MLRLLLIAGCVACIFGKPNDWVEDNDYDRDRAHAYIARSSSSSNVNPDEATASFWNSQADKTIADRLKNTINTNVAKNVILFLGDGMSITTLAASRMHMGQRNNENGEQSQLSFEKFPYTGLSKTYCVDRQVADSACSATAYLCGVKANEGTSGVTAKVLRKDCKAMMDKANHVYSVAHYSQLKGKRTGLVTTTRVTHASPSAVYAHTAYREWEGDSDIARDNEDTNACDDIAEQLVNGDTGKNLNVIFGGGREKFTPNTEVDPTNNKGSRLDGKNLINEWKQKRGSAKHQYVHDRAGLQGIANDTEYALGLFSTGHMDYNLLRNKEVQPSLEEMTVKAIRLLSQGDKGFFLFVEGGLIDFGHHANQARIALDETIEFQKAIQAAVDITNEQDTLIVVTSDHAHTMTLNGYPERGNDVLGFGGKGTDGIDYTTLSYANGPSASVKSERSDPSKADLSKPETRFPSLVPIKYETHGGEDVGIFARGPWAHLLTGVTEQNVIPHVLKYASCVGTVDGKCAGQ
ncbi:hypothetical protein PPYR_12582 [Photinus pyralis]|uniref:Alkaline phosphatase n=1 Tax=Photinus pyralis TaxID=7054 RepID=A0A5N4A6L3_PHOPY|nr:membrane-bound alkaline phosphatase-like [Photinus pyralis]KAB0792962.1 hypothetical protein PPYR_12582 [Photinus pyralis]